MNEILNYSLFEFGDYDVRVTTVIKLVILSVVTILLLYLFKKAIKKTTKIDAAKKISIYMLIKYIVLLAATFSGFRILGFDLTLLLGGSAALLVGFGLGIQSLFSDYVSGIILLVDSSVKVGDVVDIGGLVCKVEEINLRTTMVLTRDDKYIIIPNTDLTRNHIINWTHSDVASRFEINVGVDYSSDVKLVMKIMKDATDYHDGVLMKNPPFVRFTDYGESSLNFSVFFWSEEVFRVENIKSEIRIKIFEMFNQQGITIPFPQRVVHLNK